MYPLLISAIEQQIKRLKLDLQLRASMLANKDKVLFPPDQKLPEDRSAYLAELEAVLPLLRYLSEPLTEWCEVFEGSIDVPDELMPLVNKIGMQLRFHTISGVDETVALCRMVAHAQKFFHQYRPQP